jgi:hypothetical protein
MKHGLQMTYMIKSGKIERRLKGMPSEILLREGSVLFSSPGDITLGQLSHGDTQILYLRPRRPSIKILTSPPSASVTTPSYFRHTHQTPQKPP